MMAAINIGAVLVVQAGKFRVSESRESRNATRQWIMMAVINIGAMLIVQVGAAHGQRCGRS
jgi:hypothetical protein